MQPYDEDVQDDDDDDVHGHEHADDDVAHDVHDAGDGDAVGGLNDADDDEDGPSYAAGVVAVAGALYVVDGVPIVVAVVVVVVVGTAAAVVAAVDQTAVAVPKQGGYLSLPLVKVVVPVARLLNQWLLQLHIAERWLLQQLLLLLPLL